MILTDARSSEVADRIRDAVEQALQAQNVSARRASIDVVGHDGLIRDIRAGRLPSVDRIEALFDYLGLEAYFGPKRLPLRAPTLHLVSNADPTQDVPPGFFTVPWAEPSVGSGSAPLCFSRTWLESNDLKIDFLTAVKPDHIDIECPSTGDVIALIDNRAGLRKGHGLWCFRQSGRSRIGHITFAGDVTVIHPAHAEAAPAILEGDITGTLSLYGKVVWLGQSIPLKGKVG